MIAQRPALQDFPPQPNPGISTTESRLVPGIVSGHILRASVPYKDLGPEHFNRRDKKYAARRPHGRLEDLGFAVEIRPATAKVSI